MMNGFPLILERDRCRITNERQFHELLLAAENIHRRLGWNRIVKSDPFCPDIKAELKTGEVVHVELEFDADNFWKHRHPTWNVHLILSFQRRANLTQLCGLPIWSFYKYDKPQSDLEWCLGEDIARELPADSFSLADS
jgi:hypothetical protein